MVQYYANLNNQIVEALLVVADEAVTTKTGRIDEALGSALLVSLYGGKKTDYVRCSLDGAFRGEVNIGHTYDSDLDMFIAPKPFESWILDEATCVWMAPTPMPDNGVFYWDESSLSWVHQAGPFASWSWDNESNRWDAPVPYPTDGAIYAWDEEAEAWVEVQDA